MIYVYFDMDNSSDKNLYFSTSGPITIHAPQPVECPLGKIVFAGTKWNSQATYGHAPPPDYLRPTPHHLLVFTLEGEADYYDDTGVKTILRKGTLVWTRPHVNQSYGPRPGQKWSEFFVWFCGPLFDTWQSQGFPGAKSRVLFLEPVNYWLDRFRRVVLPVKTGMADSGFIRLCLFQLILAEALQIQEKSKESSKGALWFAEACRRLAEGNLNKPSLTEIAESLNMSYSLFRQRFLTLSGKSPGKFKADTTLQSACRLLLESDDSIGEIADNLGFHDAFHFSRRFREKIGMPPSSFRRQVKVNNQ
jgi:AraC-like DNA-binding protein